LAVIQDAVVAFFPALQTAADVRFCGPRLQAEEREGEVVAGGVQLRWKIIRFRFTLLANEGCLLIALVHVMGDRPQVVEELAVDRPGLELVPDRGANEARAFQPYGVLECEGLFPLIDDIAETL